MASREASKTIKVTDQMPNKRERAASQLGQIDDIVSGDWNGDPASMKDAINRLAAKLEEIRAELVGGTVIADNGKA